MLTSGVAAGIGPSGAGGGSGVPAGGAATGGGHVAGKMAAAARAAGVQPAWHEWIKQARCRGRFQETSVLLSVGPDTVGVYYCEG